MSQDTERELKIPEGTEATEPLKIYLREIGCIPLLDAEEEKELGRRSSQGDEEARQRHAESGRPAVQGNPCAGPCG